MEVLMSAYSSLPTPGMWPDKRVTARGWVWVLGEGEATVVAWGLAREEREKV